MAKSERLRWTDEEVARYMAEKFGKTARDADPAVSAADVEFNHPAERARSDAPDKIHPRYRLRVLHRSRHLADATGRSHKAAVDGLVRGGILPDDSPEYLEEITERWEQRQNEETVIEIWEVGAIHESPVR